MSLERLVPPPAYCSELAGSETRVRKIKFALALSTVTEDSSSCPQLYVRTETSKRWQNKDSFFYYRFIQIPDKTLKCELTGKQYVKTEWWGQQGSLQPPAECKLNDRTSGIFSIKQSTTLRRNITPKHQMDKKIIQLRCSFHWSPRNSQLNIKLCPS